MKVKDIEAALEDVEHFAAFVRQVLAYSARTYRDGVAPIDVRAIKRASIVVAKALAEMRKSS